LITSQKVRLRGEGLRVPCGGVLEGYLELNILIDIVPQSANIIIGNLG
jgi:hypothetical protein